MHWSEKSLTAGGFEGWVPLHSFEGRGGALELPGVYAVSYAAGKPVAWPSQSCGGFHKGKNPSVKEIQLEANWVDGATVVYIGMTTRKLRYRIREFSRFGNGEPVGHYGGRLVWQLPNIPDLRIGWKATPGELPDVVERRLIDEFAREFGKPPFANDPNKFGR